jgi:molecular chaperone DnaK (HSP70)
MEDLWIAEDRPYRFVVGIDLGTTNSAVAYVDRNLEESVREPRIRILEIPQLVTSGGVGHRRVLPSFLYLPGPFELPTGSTALPWDPERLYAVGEFAREQGALVPGHLLSSAKSWLCHVGVDRTAAILPWGAAADVAKLSPVDASSRYLRHIREAWNQVMTGGREDWQLEQQLIVLTVPASFDEVARELTVEAARRAGFERVILLEEPLAAFYAWLDEHAQGSAQTAMSAGQIILVCDVGGGTTDFTVISVRAGRTGLGFDRLAVGEHLMLGGDNMDLTIARHIETRLFGEPGKLDARRWHQLCHQCRHAKETLLADPTRGQVDVTVVGIGGKLIADTLRATLTADEVESLILDGFFPFVERDDALAPIRRTGLSEWGLPYVSEPAVTRHLAAFWRHHLELLREETGRAVLFPDYVLFNGGALAPESVRQRLAAVVQRWFQDDAGFDWQPEELPNPQPELAVAVGAAYYGLVRLGEGVRVGAGSPRAYYVQVAADEKMNAPPDSTLAAIFSEGEVEEVEFFSVPAGPSPLISPTGAGAEAPSSNECAALGEEDGGVVHAVCLVPRGAEEGFFTELQEPAFEVLANQPVAFQLFSSSTRLGDHLGDVVDLNPDEVTALLPIRTVLRFGKQDSGRNIPVRIALQLTEIGILELWCQSQQTSHRWQLQFDVRSRQEGESLDGSALPAGETLDAVLVETAQARIRAAFTKEAESTGVAPERLIKELMTLLELSRERWSAALLRRFADTLLECEGGRALSPQHEARWLNLLGYCLRPGYGDPVDEWRMKQVWKLFPQGLRFPRQAQGRSEWWVFWRRVAGGLIAGQQHFIYQQLSPYFAATGEKKKTAGKPVRKAAPQEMVEIWMALANFERLPLEAKTELGRLLLKSIVKGAWKAQELWALSRIGARIPFYGPVNRVVAAKEVLTWVKTLMKHLPRPTTDAAQALINLARPSGDRARDLPRDEYDCITVWLQPLPNAGRYVELLTQADVPLDRREQDWIFGESLPVGLRIAVQENS